MSLELFTFYDPIFLVLIVHLRFCLLFVCFSKYTESRSLRSALCPQAGQDTEMSMKSHHGNKRLDFCRWPMISVSVSVSGVP